MIHTTAFSRHQLFLAWGLRRPSWFITHLHPEFAADVYDVVPLKKLMVHHSIFTSRRPYSAVERVLIN